MFACTSTTSLISIANWSKSATLTIALKAVLPEQPWTLLYHTIVCVKTHHDTRQAPFTSLVQGTKSPQSLEAQFATRVVTANKVTKISEDEYDAAKQHGTLRGHLEKQVSSCQRSCTISNLRMIMMVFSYQAECMRQTQEQDTSTSYDGLEMPSSWLQLGLAMGMQPRGVIKVEPFFV
jgi:hypothetical protein